MIRVVLDTNTLVSGLGWPGSIAARILDHARRGLIQPVTSRALLDELARMLRYPKLARVIDQPEEIVDLIEAVSEVVEPIVELRVITRDPADNRVLEAAVAGEADFVVTGDPDLLEIASYEGIPIVRPREFLARLELN